MQYRIRRENEASEAQNIMETSWERDIMREVLLSAYRDRRRERMWKNIWRAVSTLILIALLAGIFRKDETALRLEGNTPHTAVVNLYGEIGNGVEDQVKKLKGGMEAAYKNPQAKAIIIRANSPGGSPVVSNTAFEEIRRLKAQHPDIPVYLVAEDMCASGCYYIAAAADRIYADPSSIVGSIGVIGSSFDATELMEKIGVKRRVKIAGSNKGMGDPFSPETPEQSKIWEEMLTGIHGEFIKAVKAGRGSRLKFQQYPDVFSGRVYTGADAQKVGLIDGLGNVYSVARNVVKAPDLVDYTRQDDFGTLLGRRFGAELKAGVREVLQTVR